MSKLNKFLLSEFQEIPKVILARVIESKLKKQGIEKNVEKFALDLAEHLITGSEEDFVWDDGEDKNYGISLTFSETEADELISEIEKFFEEIPNLILEIVDKEAKSQIKVLKKSWPERHICNRSEFQKFKDNIELKWGHGLNLMRIILEGAREIGNERLTALKRSKAKKNLIKRRVIILLHMRGCQTFTEIITLLENGLADGAMARWRTLYELSVVTELIAKYGDDLAIRYLDHVHVAAKKELDNDRKHLDDKQESKLSKNEQLIEDNYKSVITKYGTSFGGDYGWAAHHLNSKNPRFRHLEAAAEMLELPTEYKLASYQVHASSTGVTWSLGQIDEIGVPIAGASNAGLDTPALYSIFTFVRMNVVLIENYTKLENQITIKMLINLRDEAEKVFRKTAQKLYTEQRQ